MPTARPPLSATPVERGLHCRDQAPQLCRTIMGLRRKLALDHLGNEGECDRISFRAALFDHSRKGGLGEEAFHVLTRPGAGIVLHRPAGERLRLLVHERGKPIAILDRRSPANYAE